MWTRVAVLGTMGLVLYTLGAQLNDHAWALSCIVALALVLELLSYRRGVVQGMNIYRQLTDAQRRDIDQLLKDE